MVTPQVGEFWGRSGRVGGGRGRAGTDWPLPAASPRSLPFLYKLAQIFQRIREAVSPPLCQLPIQH